MKHFLCVWQGHLGSSQIYNNTEMWGRIPCFTSSILSVHLWGSLSGKFHKILNTAVPVCSTSSCHFITKGFQYIPVWALWRLISGKIVDFIPSSCIFSYFHSRGMYNTFLSTSETKLTPSGLTCRKVSLVSVCHHSFLSETCNWEWGKSTFCRSFYRNVSTKLKVAVSKVAIASGRWLENKLILNPAVL